jgi:hypothetical protein
MNLHLLFLIIVLTSSFISASISTSKDDKLSIHHIFDSSESSVEEESNPELVSEFSPKEYLDINHHSLNLSNP